MIRLNLTATPEWLDLAPGLRLLVGPLTTALMVSARADLAVETLPEGATQEEMALSRAKSVARRACAPPFLSTPLQDTDHDPTEPDRHA